MSRATFYDFRAKQYFVSRLKKRWSNRPSELEVHSLIERSFNQKRMWSEYFSVFYDLFTTMEVAQFKAKNYSLAIGLKWLFEKRGCSIDFLYSALITYISLRDIELCRDIINIQSKKSFCRSLEELQAPNCDF